MSACPACHVYDSTVTMTRRLANGWVKRWRRCDQPACGHKYKTFEIWTTTLEVDDDVDLSEVMSKKRKAKS